MKKESFLPKLPLLVGVVTGGATWLLIIFFLVQGVFLKPLQPEFYYQRPGEGQIPGQSPIPQRRTASDPLYFEGPEEAMVGESIPVKIYLNTKGYQVSAVDAVINVKAILATEASQGELGPEPEKSNLPLDIQVTDTNLFEGNYTLISYDGDKVKISASTLDSSKTIKGNELHLATLNLKAYSPGKVSLKFIQSTKAEITDSDTSVVVLGRRGTKRDLVISKLLEYNLTISHPTPSAYPLPTPVGYYLNLSEESIQTYIHAPNEGDAVYAILTTLVGQVVTEQTDYTYNWTIDNPGLATIEPFTGCTHGIQPPCPQDHLNIHTLQTGETMVRVKVSYKPTGSVVASSSIKLTIIPGSPPPR